MQLSCDELVLGSTNPTIIPFFIVSIDIDFGLNWEVLL
jgi:hypothetical protein